MYIKQDEKITHSLLLITSKVKRIIMSPLRKKGDILF
jgi:hypothetical protein